MKHFRLRGSEPSGVPSLLYELKIDLHDIRSGYRHSGWGFFLEGPWICEADLEWTADMVNWWDPGQLEEIHPREHPSWPELADHKVVHYLIKNYRPKAWKNSFLGLFSQSQESLEEFLARCREQCQERKEAELKKIREVFYHRFLELEQRLLSQAEREEPSETWKAHRISRIRDAFSELREQMSRLLLDASQPICEFPSLALIEEVGMDAKSKFYEVCGEFLNKHNEILAEYENQAAQIEPYYVSLSYPQIEIVSRSILWR